MTDVSTPYVFSSNEEMNFSLKILLDRNKSDVWEWAHKQLLRQVSKMGIARSGYQQDLCANLHRTVKGLAELKTGRFYQHFQKLLDDLEKIPGFIQV